MYEVLSSEQISDWHQTVLESVDLTVPQQIVSPDVLREPCGGEGEAVVAESDAEPLETHVAQSHQQSDREIVTVKLAINHLLYGGKVLDQKFGKINLVLSTADLVCQTRS